MGKPLARATKSNFTVRLGVLTFSGTLHTALDDDEAAGECELQACRERGECPLTAAL